MKISVDKLYKKILASQLVTLVISLMAMTQLHAFPFPMQDARTAALGGAGVAIDVRNAPFANPALMATSDKNYDWILMLPSRGEIITEGDDFDISLEKFQQDAPGLSLANALARAAEMDQNTVNESRFSTITVVVPSESISAVAFYKNIEYESAKIKLVAPGQGGVGNPYDAFVEHRAISVREQGVSLAKLIHDPYIIPFEDFMFGMNVKLSLIKAYGYDEDIIVGSSEFDEAQVVDQTGSVNFDFGFAKEFGVWKVGLVIKDIFSFEHEYAESGDFYKVKPLIRVGFAYQSRKTLWEIDGDITTNQAVAHQTDTKFIAMGFEHQVLPGWHLRLGVRQNMVGDKLTTQTAGMGLNYFGIEVNFAVIRNSLEIGGFSQLIVEF